MKFSLLKNEYKRENFFLVKINPALVSVLKQTRTVMTSNGIKDLISSIEKDGQRTPGDIYAFKFTEAKNYLNKINKLWNLKYEIKNFQRHFIFEKQGYYYLFLVAGHRRLKACFSLGIEYLANIHFEKNFEEAIQWQLAENLHEELPPLDLINSATSLWILLKKKFPNMTLAYFAKHHIHKSVSWLSNALRFIKLPLTIQDLIRKTEIGKGVNYSILLEFAKLYEFSLFQEKPLPEDLLLSYINHCLSYKYNLQKVRDFCLLRKEEICGQGSIFTLVPEEIDRGTISTIRRNRTIHMQEAKEYLLVGGVIARQITENCKVVARDVIQEADNLEKILPSE